MYHGSEIGYQLASSTELLMYIRAFTKNVGMLALLFATACGSSSKPVDGPKPASSQTTESAKPDSSAKTATSGKRGLDAPDNDPALVALAREALKCFRKPDCEAQGKWYEPFHMGRQVDFKTLVNLIEDEHPEIRTMAAGVLRGKKGQPGFHTDRAYAVRVLDALEREQDEYVARDIALAAGFIEVKTTNLQERMLNIIHLDTRERVRVAMIESILDNNWDVPAVTSAVKLLTEDSSEAVRAAAVRAFAVSELHDEACAFWRSNLMHKDAYLADKCFYHLVSQSCKTEFDAMMKDAEQRPPLSPENFQSLCRNEDTPAPLKMRLTDDVEKWALNTTLNSLQRVQSLQLLVICDPVRAKKATETLVKDKEDSVREAATEVKKTLDAKKTTDTKKPGGKP